MSASNHPHSMKLCLLAAVLVCISASASAQTTAFTYQGKLTDSGNLANGQYDFQFKLYDAVSGGNQLGATATVTNVTVTNGIFAVQIDFGAGVFPGANRFLEIAVKPTSGSTFTTLSPRQPVSSNPYAIRSLNATNADGLSVACVNCITSSQIGIVAGSQVSGLIPVASVPAGSGNYIQNTANQQATSNFNISGNGTAGGTLSGDIMNATTQYNISGNRVLSTAGTSNIFAGINAGAANSSGQLNSFFGTQAGLNNTTGSQNTLVGSSAGRSLTTGAGNSFFGNQAGFSNTGGLRNSFFGYQAGFHNASSCCNSFFGSQAGLQNISDSNSFFGSQAGTSNTTGRNNTFIGVGTGANSTTGNNNTFIGVGTGVSNTNEDNNTYIGFDAQGAVGITNATAIGANAFATANHTVMLGTDQEVVIVPGKLEVDTLGTAGSTSLCLNSSNRVAPCSSSLRYKTNLQPFAGGLAIINRLQPVSFTWKDGGMRDLGLGAEDVQQVEPLLTFRNANGEIEGVKYDRIAVVIVNAIKEQQQQLAAQRTQIEELNSLKAENASLKAQLADVLARLDHLEKRKAVRMKHAVCKGG